MASSSTVEKPRPPKPPGGEWIEYDQFIDRQIRKTRGQVKGVEIASALMTLATGALAFFLVAAVLDQWVLAHGLGFWGRLVCLALFLGGAGYYAAEKLLPWLIYRINPIYAAQAIEKSRPTLKNSLINFLFLRGQSAHVPKAIYEAVEQQAANGLSRVTVESAVDRSRLIHIGYALLTVVGLFAAYFLFSPKSPWDTIGRVIMPWANIQVPTRVEIIDAQPGTRTVFRGETVDVSAEIKGLKDDEPVRVVYSTADHEVVDQPVTMYLPPDRFRHSAKIPPANAAGQQSAGVQQDIDYRIEAGDAVSPTYHLTAVTAPTIDIDSVDYQFPDYTGRARISLKHIGDIQALEGTRVVIHGRANEKITSAQLELIGREQPTKLAMRVGEDGKTVTGSFTLAFDEQDRTAQQFSHYLLRPEGRAEPEPVRYRIDVIRDLAPDVKFITPEKDEVTLPVNSRLKLKLRALDPDFALSELSLSADSNGASLFEKRLLNEIRREPMQVEFTIDPAKLHLKDGNIIEYWATAVDNRMPKPNITQTARRRIRIVAADARQGDSNANEGDGQGAGNPADKSDKPSGSDKSNDNKQPQDGAQKQQDQPQADKPAGDKSNGAKSPKQQPGDKQDGADNQPENQPQDAGHDQKQDKQSPDQQQKNQNGGTKEQDPSNKQKPDGSKNNSDKQNSDNDQGANKQKPDDKQQGGGGSKSEKNSGQSSQKSDSGKGGSDSKAGGDKSGSDKSGSDKSGGDKSSNDKSGGDKSGSNDSKQDTAGGQQKNADQNPNPQGQRNERVEPDGSDDAERDKANSATSTGRAKNGSQGKPSDQSQNSDGQKQSGGEKQPGGKQSDSKNSPDSQPKPGDGQKPAGAKPQPNSQQPPNGQKPAGGQPQPQNSQQKPGDQSPKSSDAKKPTDGQKPQDGQKPGDPSAGEKSQSGNKSAADKSNGDQPSTKEGDAQNTAAKKPGSDKSAGDKSKGANSTKEDAPTKPSGDKADSSKSGDKSDKPGTEQNRDSSDGQNKSGNGEKPDQGNGDRTKDGSQPTGDKHPPQGDKDQSQTKAGDPDSDKGESGAGTDTAKDDKATPPSPSDTNQPSRNKKVQPKSAGKKESQGKDEGKSPTTSPKESNSQGDQDGDRSGGGKKGGGQGANQAGTGGAGKNTAADQGNGVAKGHGQGEDSSKAGADKASNHKTGKSGDKEGPGSHTKAADSDHPNNPAPAKSPDDQGKSSASAPQGSAGKSPDNPSGPGGSGYEPRGGGNNSGTPPNPPPSGPETAGDAANRRVRQKAIRHGVGVAEKRQARPAQGIELDSRRSPKTGRAARADAPQCRSARREGRRRPPANERTAAKPRLAPGKSTAIAAATPPTPSAASANRTTPAPRRNTPSKSRRFNKGFCRAGSSSIRCRGSQSPAELPDRGLFG